MGKEQQMDMRIVSAGSAGKVYHRPECRYARKIYRRNREQMLWENAEAKGYRPCDGCLVITYDHLEMPFLASRCSTVVSARLFRYCWMVFIRLELRSV